MRPPILPAVCFAFLILAACGGGGGGGAVASATPRSAADGPRSTAQPRGSAEPASGRAGAPRTVARRLEVPWGIGFLPGGAALVTERTTGRVKRIPRGGGRARTVITVPGVARSSGEGGLLGLAVSPRFRRDRLVYVYYTTARDNRIGRFRLGSRRVRPILTGLRQAEIHNGGRLRFGPDKKLYAAVGDAAETGTAQDRGSLNGKILRLEPDGSAPADNPFPGSRVYSLGHRNPQGLAWDRRGRMYAAEFGQDRFDEVNRIRPGGNYGWPDVEGEGNTRGGRFTNPLKTWRTSEASPSGIAIRGSRLYMAGLGGRRLFVMPVRRDGSLGSDSVRYRDRWGRLRTVVTVPGRRGGLWVATSNRDGRGDPAADDDRIFRIPG